MTVQVLSEINSFASESRRFLFLLASARINGNSEQLARYAAQYLPSESEQVWLRLSEFEMSQFKDKRHINDGRYAAPEGAMAGLLEATLTATDIVFVTPLYWYSLPASAKQYLDHWSGWMRVPELNFLARMAGKSLWNITVSSDLDQSYAQPLIDTLRHSAAYAEMQWRGALVGYGNRPGDVMQHEASLVAARVYFLESHSSVA